MYNEENGVDLITVPAVERRVLRFEGSSLHAVPRTADLWFLSFVRGAPNYTPEEEWGRYVILFRTWTKELSKAIPFLDSDDDIGILDVNLSMKEQVGMMLFHFAMTIMIFIKVRMCVMQQIQIHQRMWRYVCWKMKEERIIQCVL